MNVRDKSSESENPAKAPKKETSALEQAPPPSNLIRPNNGESSERENTAKPPREEMITSGPAPKTSTPGVPNTGVSSEPENAGQIPMYKVPVSKYQLPAPRWLSGMAIPARPNTKENIKLDTPPAIPLKVCLLKRSNAIAGYNCPIPNIC